MNNIILLKRLLQSRPLQNLLAVTVMAVSIAAAVSIMLLAEGLHNGLVQAARPFPMVMGSRGSSNQLVLNTVFMQDQPAANFDYSQIERLRADKNVAKAIPMGMGDNYRGHRIIGTEPEFFSLKREGLTGKNWLQLAEGRVFSLPYEAVLGAETARSAGLKVGDSFASVHGVISHKGGQSHGEKYKVVGILKPVDGPYDSSILVSLESLWWQHAHGSELHREATAAVVVPAGYANALQLSAVYNKDRDVQMIFPSQKVIELFSVMGNAEKILQLFSAAVIVLALVITGSSLYWFANGSRREQAVMRALGASAAGIMQIYFRLGMLMVLCGTAAGLLLGHGVFWACGALLQGRTSICLSAGFLPGEALLVALVLSVGALISLLPAKISSGRDIVEDL